MNPIRLEDLVPHGASFALRKTEKTYRLRPMSLADEIWMKETFGETVQSIFSELKVKEICRIAFRLMEESDKADFAAQDVTIMNEEGETLVERLGGANLMFLMISGYDEKIKIIEALLQTIGISKPLMKELSGKDEKKRPKAATGPESLTYSRPSTDGQPNISSAALRGKSRGGSKVSRKG